MPTSAELFEQALRFHQSGDLAQAVSLYQQVIQGDPTHVDAHTNLGVALHAGGHFSEALSCFREVVRLNPHHAEGYFNLGYLLAQQGQLAEGAAYFRQALSINPNFTNALNSLGIALLGQKKLAEAAECFRQVIRIDPLDADAHCNLGIILKEQGRWAEAVASYRQALLINPNFANAYVNLGNALVAQEKVDEAIACFRQALHLNPQQANAHNNLGLALYGQKQLAEAIACYREGLRINPNYAQGYDNLGTALFDLGQLAEAEECFRNALRLDPNYANALNNLGNTLARQLHLAEAAELYHQALRVDSGHKNALWNRSLLRLLQGDFAGGWPDYEQRWAQPGILQQKFPQPRWEGAPLQGKTILVYAEQGLGDTIQFVRYLPMVKERGGTVLLGCQPSLVNLCTGIAGVVRIVADGETLPPFDIQIPLLSLPGLFGTRMDNIPADVPYLQANPALVEHWGQEIERGAEFIPAVRVTGIHPPGISRAARLFIGIAWQGSMNQPGDPRSLPLRQFEVLARLPNVQLISLQVGPGAREVAANPFNVIDLGSHFNPKSLDDLAAAIMNVDLVISVDTAVAHLAGALGVPVWTLLSLAPDWRWLLERKDNPWYPTMRLFRQRQLGQWNEVLEQVAAEVGLVTVRRTGLG